MSGWQIWLASVLLLIIAFLGQVWQLADTRADLAEARATLARQNEAIAAANAEAERQARAAETEAGHVIADIGAAYLEGERNAEITADRTIADLRSGALGLRREWTMCETGRVAETAAAQRRIDQADRSREELAAAAVRIGATCDAKERALIRAYDGVRAALDGGNP
jgi:hypothetical protein